MLSSKDIIKAHKVLNGVVVDTPLDYDHYLSEVWCYKDLFEKKKMPNVFVLLKFVVPNMPFVPAQQERA